MNYKIAALIAGSTFAIAAPASAQVADESPFTGARAQAVVGYDSLRAGSDIDDDQNQNNDQSIEGFAYGAAIGYDVDLGPVVVGPEAELSTSTADTDFENGDFEGFGFGRVNAGRDIYLGARVGAKVGPQALVYAKGGYTNARLEIGGNDTVRDYNQKFDLDGYRVGAGAEYAVNQNVFLNLEYRYSNYSEGEVDFNGDLPDGDRFNVDLDRHQVMAGVGVRF